MPVMRIPGPSRIRRAGIGVTVSIVIPVREPGRAVRYVMRRISVRIPIRIWQDGGISTVITVIRERPRRSNAEFAMRAALRLAITRTPIAVGGYNNIVRIAMPVLKRQGVGFAMPGSLPWRTTPTPILLAGGVGIVSPVMRAPLRQRSVRYVILVGTVLRRIVISGRPSTTICGLGIVICATRPDGLLRPKSRLLDGRGVGGLYVELEGVDSASSLDKNVGGSRYGKGDRNIAGLSPCSFKKSKLTVFRYSGLAVCILIRLDGRE